MKIAMISEHASPLAAIGGVDAGGQNVHVAALAGALARVGASVVVHTRRDDIDLPRRVPVGRSVTVDHVDAGPPHELSKDELLPHMQAFAEDLARQWERDRPDIVHAHFWMSGMAALAAARPLRIPVVQTFHALGTVKRRHQGTADTSPPQRRLLEPRVAAEADHIIATCTDEVAELARLEPRHAPVTVIPCGVDLDRFVPHGPVAPRRRDTRRLLVVGRLVPRKGVGDIIAALARLDNTELVIAGGPAAAELDSDAEVQRLRALADDVGVADRIAWLGCVARDDMPALLRSADVVVCAPWYEPFGIVPVEAAACGVPVVATAVGGMLDSVVDGVTGLHVRPRDPDDIAAAVRRLLDADNDRKRMGWAAARRARDLYGWDAIGSRSYTCYRALVSQVVEVAS